MAQFFKTPIRPVTAYSLIAIVWIITRAYSFTQTAPWQFWEIWEARKLLDYGFFARQGGIINVHFMTGMLDSPERFNYVNHPYPVLWIFTLFYYLAGEWGALLWASLLGLISTLAVYPALRVRFTSGESLLGALLFAVAPTAIIMDVNPNLVALGAVGWPFIVLCLAKLEEGFSYKKTLLLAAVVFVMGQISWFTYTISAAVILPLVVRHFALKNPAFALKASPVMPILIGSLATLTVFLFQIWYYTFDLAEVIQYARGQAGSEAAVSLPRMYLGILMRVILSVGPGLLVGGALGFLLMLKRADKHWLEWIAATYVIIFAVASLLLPRFYFREVTMYEYLVFPLTVGTLYAIKSMRNTFFTGAIAILAVMSLVYPTFQASIPQVSEKSRAVAAAIKENTAPDEFVATNMAAQTFPFDKWDVGSANTTAMLADRFIKWGIDNKERLNAIPSTLKIDECPVTYVFCTEIPMDPALREVLSLGKLSKRLHIDLPVERVTLSSKLRNVYWNIVGKHQVEEKSLGAVNKGADLEFYQVTAKRR